MKLDKKDNVKLMKECCIVKEIEYTQKRLDQLESKFRELQYTLDHSENLTFDNLHEKFDTIKIVKNFLTEMQKSSKFKITTKYYKKAVDCATKHASENNCRKLTSQLKKQFLRENRIKNLKVRTNMARYIGASVTTILASGTLLTTSLATTTQVAQPPTQTATTINMSHLQNLLKNSDSSKAEDFASLYLKKYNSSNPRNPITRDNFKANLEETHNYIYKIQIGNEPRYISHGDSPAMIEKYFKNNHIEPEIIYDCHVASIYLTDATGNIQYSYDEFGNKTKTKLDSAISINGQYVKLYDGNNPKDLLNPKSQSNSPLAELQNNLHTKPQMIESSEYDER